MKNSQISARIKRLAAMLTLLNENPNKIRAFEKASRSIAAHPEEMGVLIDEDRLKQVQGIGATLAKLILNYAKSGGSGYEKELESRLPPGLPDLLDLKGLGLKKVQILWQEHQITDMASLEKACLSNAVAGWQGFGPKLEQQLLKSIAFKTKHLKDFKLNLASGVAKAWLETLLELPAVQQVELTGQLRRGNELIRRVDFVVEAELDILTEDLKTRLAVKPLGAEPVVIMDPSGMPIQLWLATPETFQARQLLLTGGQAYLEQIGSVLSEKGLEPGQISFTGQVTSFASETDLCDHLGLQWIEPELRDGFNTFPADRTLIRKSDIRGVLHAHSTWSDGINSLQEMVEGTRNLGYKYLGISDHSQAAYYANGLKPDRVRAQWDRIDELNELYQDFRIFKGIEADILADGRLDYTEELLSGFDFVIASIHSHFHLSPVEQTDRLIRALQSPYTTILGHPTGRMLLAREGYNPDLPAVIEAAAEYDKVIEINSTPKRLDLDWRYLSLTQKLGVKVSINPDAHSLKGLESISYGITIARKGGLAPEDAINTMNTAELAGYFEARKIK